MTSPITDFITACLDADEAAARAWPADQHDWKAAGSRYLSYASGCGERVGAVNVGGDYYGWERIYIKSDLDDDLSGYLARHDPARVLREVEAKRAILADHQIKAPYEIERGDEDFGCERCYSDELGVLGFGYCPTLKALAAVWSDHPDYRKEWAA